MWSSGGTCLSPSIALVACLVVTNVSCYDFTRRNCENPAVLLFHSGFSNCLIEWSARKSHRQFKLFPRAFPWWTRFGIFCDSKCLDFSFIECLSNIKVFVFTNSSRSPLTSALQDSSSFDLTNSVSSSVQWIIHAQLDCSDRDRFWSMFSFSGVPFPLFSATYSLIQGSKSILRLKGL